MKRRLAAQLGPDKPARNYTPQTGEHEFRDNAIATACPFGSVRIIGGLKNTKGAADVTVEGCQDAGFFDPSGPPPPSLCAVAIQEAITFRNAHRQRIVQFEEPVYNEVLKHMAKFFDWVPAEGCSSNCTSHCLRHGCAVWYLRRQVPPTVVANLLRDTLETFSKVYARYEPSLRLLTGATSGRRPAR